MVLLLVFLVGVASASPSFAQPEPSAPAKSPADPRLISDPSAHLALRRALHGDPADRPADRPATRRTPPTSQSRTGAALRTGSLYQYWDGSSWEDFEKVRFEYGDDGQPAQTVWQTWTGSTWTDLYRIVYAYTDGLLTEELSQFRSGPNWETVSRLLYHYTDGNATEWREQVWAGAWYDYRRLLLTYAAAGRYVETLAQDWDSIESEWQNESRYFFAYTEAGAFAEIRGEFWTGTAWENAEREVYAYDGDGLLAEWALQGWYETWADEYRERYTYADGLLVGSLAQWVDEGTWEDVYRTAFTNDAAGNAVEEVGQYFEVTVWLNDSRTFHTYAATTSAEPTAPTASALAVAVYPNPTRGDATIEIALAAAGTVEWAVYDVVGRRVAAGVPLALGTGTHEVALPVAGLLAGVYVVRVQSAGAATVRRLTVVR
jgi:hypothetical protein